MSYPRHTGEYEGIWTGHSHSLVPSYTIEAQLYELEQYKKRVIQCLPCLWKMSKKIEDRQLRHDLQIILKELKP